ncbi:MAG: DUF3105 domain-containing protein [Candidatus Methylomirabilales bacterium]
MRQATKKERREAARQDRLQADRRRRRARRRVWVALGGLAGVMLVAAGALGVPALLENRVDVAAEAKTAGCSSIEKLDSEGVAHLKFGDPPPAYKTNPATSGSHLENPALWGPYPGTTIPPEIYVHNMEHGGVVIHTKPLPSEEVIEVVESYEVGVIVHPNPAIDRPIAITSWQHLQTCDRVSVPVIRAFIKQRCGRGPEAGVQVRCQ